MRLTPTRHRMPLHNTSNWSQWHDLCAKDCLRQTNDLFQHNATSAAGSSWMALSPANNKWTRLLTRRAECAIPASLAAGPCLRVALHSIDNFISWSWCFSPWRRRISCYRRLTACEPSVNGSIGACNRAIRIVVARQVSFGQARVAGDLSFGCGTRWLLSWSLSGAQTGDPVSSGACATCYVTMSWSASG